MARPRDWMVKLLQERLARCRLKVQLRLLQPVGQPQVAGVLGCLEPAAVSVGAAAWMR